MNEAIEFLTWNQRYVYSKPLWTQITGAIFILVCLLIVSVFILKQLGNLIELINKRFFTVYEFELDEIDEEEKEKNQNGSI